MEKAYQERERGRLEGVWNVYCLLVDKDLACDVSPTPNRRDPFAGQLLPTR